MPDGELFGHDSIKDSDCLVEFNGGTFGQCCYNMVCFGRLFLSLSVMNLPEKKPVHDARTLLKQLEQQFPVFQSALPLAIGIDKQLAGRLPGVDKKALRIALGLHTNSTRYLKVFEKAQQRFDLDGNVAGEVTDEHRARASEVLKERFKKIAEQRREKQQAEREAARRQEKLQQLAEKFSPRR